VTMTAPRLTAGDTVRHPRRPEWGIGRVLRAQSPTGEAGAQRVTVDFPGRGRLTIDTGTVALEPATDAAPAPPEARSEADRMLEALERMAGSGEEALADLPEAMTDPLTSLRERLRRALEGYRFPPTDRGRFDWAVARTGLNDPLSHHSRDAIAEAFTRYRRRLDRHVGELVRQMQQAGRRQELNTLYQACRHEAGRRAMLAARRDSPAG